MKLWKRYIRQKRRGILAGVLFAGIFALTFALYQLPLKAVWYPVTLCAFLGCLFLMLDFLRVRRKHRVLLTIKEFSDLLTENLPMPDEIEGEDYQAILKLLHREFQEMNTESQKLYAELVDYYAIWVHQIKTPIASMRLALQNEDTNVSRQLTNDLFRIEQYVEMVMTFLRLNSEQTDYVLREYDLDEIIRQAVRKFAGEFIGRNLKLIYDPLHKSVLTDEKWFSFVIEQVLSNALKYTPSGSISITLENENRLCIHDSGIGIAKEDLPRIFDRGYTGYNGRIDKKASGIGLYLCKRICNRLGHEIEAESIVDQGTSIYITLSREKLEVE